MVRETRHLWVGNLPETVREERIREHFKRYGRVQSVRIIISSTYNPTSASAASTGTGESAYKDQQLLHGDNHPHNGPSLHLVAGQDFDSSTTPTVAASSSASFTCTASSPSTASAAGSAAHSADFSASSSYSSSNNHSGSHKNTSSVPSSSCNGGNDLVINVCATIAFMDIKSASKAHTAEHKFDDRILTTEYYEPPLHTMPPTVGPTAGSGSASCSTTTPGDSNCISVPSSTVQKHASGNSVNCGSIVSNSGSNLQYSPPSGIPFMQSINSVMTSAIANSSNNCANGGGKSEVSSAKMLGPSDEHGSIYDNGTNASNCTGGNSRSMSITRSQGGGTIGDDHSHGNCNSSNLSMSGGNGRRISATNYPREPSDGGQGIGIRGRQRDRQHYRNGPYSTLPERSNPINHHRISSSSWYGNSSNSGGGDNLAAINQPQSTGVLLSPLATPSTRNIIYSAATAAGGGQQDHSNQTSSSSLASTIAPNTTTIIGACGSAIGSEQQSERSNVVGININNNSYDKFNLKKRQKSRSSDSESPSDGGHHHHQQQQSSSHHHHHSHHSRHTPPPVPSAVPHHHHHSHLSGHHNHNHIIGTTTAGGSFGPHSHNSRSDRSNSRSRSRSPSSSCSSTNSTTTSQSNETSSTTRSPANLALGGSGSSGPVGSVGRERRSERIDRDSATIRGGLQSAVTVSSNNNGSSSSSGASNSSGSGGGNLNCHSEDNRPLAICVRNLPARSSDTSLKDGLFHEYKKHGKVTWVKVVGQNTDRYALVCFKKPEDVEKALEVSHDKLFFGCKIEVAPYQGYDVDDNEFRPYEAELDEYHPKSTRTLFIGNLEKDITSSELRKHFDCFGEIIEIDIKKQGVSAYAFCQYSDIVSVVKAMRKMDGEHLGSNRIKLGFGKSMPTNCVWIDGIADSVSEGYLKTQFDHFGAVSQVTIDRERKLALVFFEQVQCAQSAVKEMRGATLRGRKLQVDFASRECQDAFFDKLDKQSSTSFGSPRFESGSAGRYSNSRYLETSTRNRATSFSRPGNPISLGGAVSPRLDPSPASRGGAGGGSSTRSRIVRYSSDDYYLDGGANPHSTNNDRRFRNYDEYSQGSGASSHEDVYEHDSYNSGHTRSSVHDRLQPPPVSDSPPPPVTSSSLSFSIQSRLGDVEPVVGQSRKRNEKSPGDIRYLQKERVHILEQLEECPSSGDELVSPKKRIKYNSDAHHGSSSDPSDHHHPHYASSTASAAAATANDAVTSGSSCDPVMATGGSNSGGASGGGGGAGHLHYNSNNSSSNHYNSSHHHHHHHNSSDNSVQSGFSSSSTASHHRKCVEVRRLSDCILQQSKSLSSQSTPSSMHSNNNSRRPSTESSSLHQRHGSSSSNSSSSLQQSHLDSGHLYSHSLNKRRKTILNSDNSMTVIASAGTPSVSANEHHHSSRGRGHQLHSIHSHEASGGESADGSRPGTPLCDERPENLPPSEPRRIPASRTYNQEPMSLPLPRFAIQFLQQYRLQNQQQSTAVASVTPTLSTTASSAVSCPSLSQSSSTSIYSTVTNSSVSQPTHTAASSSGVLSSLPSLLSNSSLPNSAMSSPPPMHATKLSLIIPSNVCPSNNSTSGDTPASASTSTSLEHGGGSQAPASPLRAPSVSSNSSDSEAGPSTSPSLEERINRLDELYEKWSGSSQTRANNNAAGDHHFNDRHHNHHLYHHNNHVSIGATTGSLNQSPISNVSSSSTSSFRHRFLELDVHEVPPSDIVKSLLSRKSIFDEDLKRLENISDKYEPGAFANYSKPTINLTAIVGSTTSSATVSPVNTIIASQSPLHALKAQTPPASGFQRLGGSCSTSGSPMNSPQPYNSPNPSVKSCLQYPFPSHPPTLPLAAVTTSTPGSTTTTTVSSMGSMTTTTGSTNIGTISTFSTTTANLSSVPSSSSSPLTTCTSALAIPTLSTCATTSCYSSTATPTTTVVAAALAPAALASCKSSITATLANKPKTNVLNKSISLTEKASTNISSNNSNNLSSNNNVTSTIGSSSSISASESLSVTTTTTFTATTTSLATPKVSSTISSSSSLSVSSVDTVVTASNVADAEASAAAAKSSTTTTTTRLPASYSFKSTTITSTPPGSTNSGTVRSSSIPTPPTNATPTEEVHLHSTSSNNNHSNSPKNSEKEDKSSSGSNVSGGSSKHHKDRRKLSTCSTNSGSAMPPAAMPTTSSGTAPSLPEPKSSESLPTSDNDQSHPHHHVAVNARHTKSNKLNHHHSHRHSSDSCSSSSSSLASTATQKSHQRDTSDDMNDFDRLKRDMLLNSVKDSRSGGTSGRKEKDREEQRDREKEHKQEDDRTSRTEKGDQRRLPSERQEKEHEDQKRKEEQDDRKRSSEQQEKEFLRERQSQKERSEEREKVEREKRNKDARVDHEHGTTTTSKGADAGDYVTAALNKRQINHHHEERRGRVDSTGSSSPSRNTSKRRFSSQDSNDSPHDDVNVLKRYKQNDEDSGRNATEARDTGKDGRKDKHPKGHNRAEKSFKSSSVSSSCSETSFTQPNALNIGGKQQDNLDAKQQFLLEERRKEMPFSGEDQIQQHNHHRKKERYHEKHKSKKDRDASRDKENTQSANFGMDTFADHRSTSDDDDHAHMRLKKDRSNSKDYRKQCHGESGGEYKKYERKHSRAESSADEEGRKKKTRPNNNRTKTANGSSDTDDSDEPKKHSIFDIIDEGPNISMYDKVKARSCKNMQKHEEEKKIKAKFSKLKQSRAKREGKNRSKSWDEDSDSDGMNSDTNSVNSKYNHKDQLNKSGMITTSDDEDHLPSTPRFRRHMKDLASDSDEENNRIQTNRDRLNNLCDDESSDGEHSTKQQITQTSRRSSAEKKISRKNSRSTRIQSDSDTEDGSTPARQKLPTTKCENKHTEQIGQTVDNEKYLSSVLNMDVITVKAEIKREEGGDVQEDVTKPIIKVETKVQPPSALITSDVSDDDAVKSVVKSELIPSTMIKREPADEVFSSYTKQLSSGRNCEASSEGEQNASAQVSTVKIQDTVNFAVEQLAYGGHSEAKKKHKKKQKRHKTFEGTEGELKSEKTHSPCDEEGGGGGTMGSMFDEPRKNLDDHSSSTKKKHSGRKEKRRERSKEEYEKSGKSKKSKNKHKEFNKLSEVIVSSMKREDKMEDIFGPISDEESHHSSVETETSARQDSIDSEPKVEEEVKSPVDHRNDCETSDKEKIKEDSRRRKEKKRREREKLRAAITMKEEENSVDLDEAGRALEAQLMSDSDQKAEDASPASTVTTSGKRSSVDVMDVFRFTDGDDSMETSFNEKKESDHGRKEKKKKKKRGKDEKHKHHHSSSSSSNNNNHVDSSPANTITQTSNKLSLDITSALLDDSKHNISKPSPSLPCLLDESPPSSNMQPALQIAESNPVEPSSSVPISTASDTLPISPVSSKTEEAQFVTTKDDNQFMQSPESSASLQSKRKQEKLIPGFGSEIDEHIHQKAVLSISGEFITEKNIKDELKSSDTDDSLKHHKSDDLKIEEKSRVVISQEETEDAVAALLGESFGTSNTPDFSIDYSIDQADESSSQLINDPGQIPEEDDEEMKKAILSLNTEEHIKLDMKPDTPQSEHDLQIDTDTDDQPDDEHPASLLRFDNPPKTPDVDLSQIGKSLSDVVHGSVSAPNSVKKDDKLEMPDTPGKNCQIVEPTPVVVSSVIAKITTTTVAAISSTTSTATTTATMSATPPTTTSTIKPTVSLQAPKAAQKQIATTTTTEPTSSTVKDSQAKIVTAVSKSITVFTSTSLPTQTKPTVKQTAHIQPHQSQMQSPTRHQYIVQAPPTITIPEQHIVYQPVDTIMSPRGQVSVHDPRMQSPKLQLPQQTGFPRTPPSSATSPNLPRPQQSTVPNRNSPQLSPVISSHSMIIHQQSGRILVSSPTSSSSQFSPKTVQIAQPVHTTGPRFPVVTQLKPAQSPQKVVDQLPIKQIGTHIAATNTASISSSQAKEIATSGTKVVTSTSTMPTVANTFLIHNTKMPEPVQKVLTGGGTPTKTVPSYIQHSVNKPFVPSMPGSQQPIRTTHTTPVSSTPVNVAVSKPKEDIKLQNTISTIMSNPNHNAQSTQALPTVISSDTCEKSLTPNAETHSAGVDSSTNKHQQTNSKLESLTAEETKKQITESQQNKENIANITVGVSNTLPSVLAIDQEDPEGDSKEDSDYWSTKDTIIDSVIKKVDALCSEDDPPEGGSTLNDDKPKPLGTILHPSDLEPSCKLGTVDDKKAEKPEPTTAVVTTPTVPPPVSTVQTVISSIVQQSPPVTTEIDTHTGEEDEHDDASTENAVQESSPRGGKRGGRRGGGRKTSESVSTPVKVQVSETEMNTPAKRGGKAGSKRGRGAGRSSSVRVEPSVVQSVPLSGLKAKSLTSGSDIYEFHDDSGEEVTTADKHQPDGTRPRLILTIKNQAGTTAPVSNIQTTSTSCAPVVTSINSTPLATVGPTPSCPASQQPPVEVLGGPIPVNDSSKEEFIHPSANTRKSRRLLEKDGRTTVDDIIEDVIRNGPSPRVVHPVPNQQSSSAPMIAGQQFQSQQISNSPQSAQIGIAAAGSNLQPLPPSSQPMHSTGPTDASGQPNRRATRQQHVAAGANIVGADVRKSPRACRKGKDRKISETSVDSSDEKSSLGPARTGQMDVKTDEKSVSGILSATAPITLSVSVTRPNETASLADKSKEKPKSADEVKNELGCSQVSSLSLIDPVTGELTMMRTSKEGQYVPMPNAPQPLKKVIAAAANAQNAAEQQKAAISAIPPASPIPNRALTPGSSPSPGLTRVPTPNTTVPSHLAQQMEAQKLTSTIVSKQNSQLLQTSQAPTVPATTVVVPPSPLGTGTVVIQHAQGHPQVQHPQPIVQQTSTKPHTLKAHVLNSQQMLQQQQQQQQQHPGKPPTQVTSQQQTQIVYKSVIPHQQPGAGAIHTTTGKQIHPSTSSKMPPQVISQGGPSQPPQQQHIIIQNPLSQQQLTINKHTLINKSVTHQSAVHHPPGSGNLLINIPQNMHHLGSVQMSPRMPQHHQVVITNTKPTPGSMQSQSQHSPHVIHKQTTVQTQQSNQPNPSGTQQIIIHGGKVSSGHHQIPAGYTTVLQSGGKIIHQGPVQLASQPQPLNQGQQQPSQQQPHQQQSIGMPGKHAAHTIQVSSGSSIPIQYQSQPLQSHPSVVHKTVTAVHGGQQVKIQQHKVGSESLTHMQSVQQQLGGGKPMVVQHTNPTVTGKLSLHQQPQQQQQPIMSHNHSVGLTKGNHAIQQQQQPPPGGQSGGNQQQQVPSSQQLLTIQQGKGISPHLHQAPQILTGAVASPPLKQPHMQSQQPIVTGASSSRVTGPPISPQGQPSQQPSPVSHLRHVQQPGLNVPPQVAYEANPHADFAGFITRGQSPPPAHQQQTSPITPTDATFRGGMPRDYVKYMYGRNNIHIPSRSPMLPGSVEQRELSEMKETVAASPPLELRRPSSGPRPVTTAVPHSLQSPGDRSTDSPQVAQVYIGSARIPHTYSDSLNTLFYDPAAGGPNVPPRALSTEPPPAHRPHNLSTGGGGFPPGSSYPGTPSQTPPPASPANLSQVQQRDQQQQQQQQQQRDRELQQQQRDRITMPAHTAATPISASPMPVHSTGGGGGGIPVVISQQQTAAGRNLQVATPPIGGAQIPSVPPQNDSLEALLQRYPVMWQGLLALKNDQAAVQMHFVHGNPGVAGSSLPSNSDGTTPPLRIAQRMRLEPAQIDGVARKMQMDQEHCMLLALPCGRDRMDVLQQQNNLQTGFITYLQQKQAAGIVNIAAPGSSQAAYVVHIFPSCEFANDNLARIAPDLMHRVANIQYLLIVIATV
ncbi:protein split ends isoform X2 [Toxorhynchites rutilus septentrionalis]|uniref:protein split ends isoform X2 n=1 Tax=Toxorhynchites rutilus septentrionalis TaxID=329112 RepID=UPI00247B23B6|nr:protein split ends isoform X2 [Toxorhynchites rutilus septentrionalis]